jgi:hypothetical protein
MENVAGTLGPLTFPTTGFWIMHPIALLGWLGAALSIALPWPQFWRSVVRGHIKGLSATACWQGMAMPVGWITYGLLTGETVQVVTNVVTGSAGLTVLVVVLVKQRELRTCRRLLVSGAGAATVLSAAAVSATAGLLTGIGSARAGACLGGVLGISAILGAIPQPLSLLRDRGQDLAGLSPLRWWLAAGACTSWCAYGLATGQTGLWLAGLVGLGSALIVCWVLAADRRATATAGTVRPAHAATTVRPAHAATTVRPARAAVATLRPVHAAVATVRPAHTVVVTAGAVARPAHGRIRVVRPASATLAASSAPSGRAAALGRPLPGTARGTVRPVGVRPARGVAPVPRPTDRPILIMTRELAAA